MDSSKIVALGSPRPPTIASRRPMLSAQRSLSALSINTSTTHADMMRRNSTASTTSKHRKLHTPTNVPPIPLSANSGSSMSPEELSSKIADSFQQFSSMLSQLSSNKSTANTALALATPPLIHSQNSSTNDHISNIIPIQQETLLSPQKLPSPPLQTSGFTMTSSPTKSSNREVLRPTTNFISSQERDTNKLENNSISSVKKSNIKVDEEIDNDDDINMEGYIGHALYVDNVLKVLEIPATPLNEGNTKLRQRVITKCFTRAASIGDTDTMQKMLESIKEIDINYTDDKKTGITALMYASYFGQTKCVLLLLKQSTILINQQDKKGWTALMWAINSNRMDITQILLDNGAEKSVETYYGRTVFDYPTSAEVKELLGSAPSTKSTTERKEKNSESVRNVLVPGSNTSETEHKSNEDGSATVEVDYYQTAVNGYNHFLSGSSINANTDLKKKSVVGNTVKSNVHPPDFSQLIKTTTSPQQEQRDKERMKSSLTVNCNNVVDDEDLKRWETSIKSSNTFSWSQCLPDQMFVFSQDDLHVILDQAFNVTDTKSFMNMSQLSNELWRPANIVFLSARFAHYCSSRELLNTLFSLVNVKLSRIIKTNYRDIYALAYWIANICQLSSYLKKDPGLCVSTSEAQENLSALISEAYSLFVSESQKKIEKILEPAMIEFESIQELEHIDFVDDWQRFFRRSSMIHSRKSNDIERKLSIDSASSITTPLSNNLNDNTSSISLSPHSVTCLLTMVQSTLQAYHIPSAIVIQAIVQFFHYLSCELFNRVLTYKKYICRSRALQIRMNLSAMEEWVRTNQLPSSLNNAFEPLIQLLQLLQCLSQMDDTILFSSTIQTFDKLNPLQVKRCVQNYRYEVSEPRLPDEVEQLANQMAQEYQQQLMAGGGRRNSGSNNVIPTRSSMDNIGGKSNFAPVTSSKGAGRPASISSLNCLLSNTTNKKRLSAEDLAILSTSAVQQLDEEDDYDDGKGEKRNSKYVLPFSIPITTALLQDWTEERHKKSVNSIGDSNNYSDIIYQEIKLKKQEQLNLLDKIYPTISEEWLYHLDRRLYTK